MSFGYSAIGRWYSGFVAVLEENTGIKTSLLG